ncbi:MAG: 6-phospho-beta-glucosidase [Anaerolineaceae bacterium]|nr:MAG: 6-phospho-beta-glucosidase [Anaerolineaceae bacterium]
MKGIKIATIGGGSSYTPELIEGFIKRYDKLPVSELWLVDIEEGKHKLEIVGDLAKRMVDAAGIPMKIYTTLDRREALKDADFVTTQLRVGLLDARVKDERIPLSHGLLGQETNGAGGLFKAFRTIPVILDICKDMDELCKDAWLINFTNPVGIVMEAIHRYSNRRKAVGLCNLPIGMHKEIAGILKRPMEEVHVTFSGLNHMVFVTAVHVDGRNVLEKVIDNWGTQSAKNVTGKEWDRGFIKALGAIPCYYHRYYYMAKEYLDEGLEYYKQNGTRAEKVKKIEDELFELYQNMNLSEKPKQLEERGGAYYSDAACNLICSIYNDTRDIQVVNTVNNGAIPELEFNEIGEMGCIIAKEGPIPIAAGKLPKATSGLIQQIKSFEIAACEAAVSGDYDKALLAMMINPLVGSQDLAIKVLDEMLEAHKEYLPLFFN